MKAFELDRIESPFNFKEKAQNCNFDLDRDSFNDDHFKSDRLVSTPKEFKICSKISKKKLKRL